MLEKMCSPGLTPSYHRTLYCVKLHLRHKYNMQLTQGLVHAVIACNNQAGHALNACQDWVCKQAKVEECISPEEHRVSIMHEVCVRVRCAHAH